MIIKVDEPLSQYTTFRMGGKAKNFIIPESTEELKEIVCNDPQITDYLIGGGSNLLINDAKEFEQVLCLRNFNSEIRNEGPGEYYVGASVRLQKLIRTINNDGFGGIEYLFSVPALVGGAVYMNAGRGKAHHKCISDYIVSVDVLKNGTVLTYSKENCHFEYRKSRFHEEKNTIIVGALFRFEAMDRERSGAMVQERIDLCKRVQDMSAPNFGTVFCESNKYIMAMVKAFHWGYKNGCSFSSKTKNWMLHGNKGTFIQAVALINRVKNLHTVFGQRCKAEVRIWE